MSFVYGLISSSILYPCLLGEGAFALWLLFVGVNEPKWRAASERRAA